MEQQYAPGIPVRVTDYANSVRRKFEANTNTSFVKPRYEAADDLPVLPPGVSRQRFNAAIEELRKLVDDNVELVDSSLDDGWYLHRPLTHDAFPLNSQDQFVNSAICCPGSSEQVQAVVRWANKWLITIYPISMGRNLGMSTRNSLFLRADACRIWRCRSTGTRLCSH